MTKTIKLLFVLFIASCSSRPEQIENELKPFIEKNFPTAEHNVYKQGNAYKLTILTEANISESEIDKMMTMTLREFYRSFYEISNETSTNSYLIISFSTNTNTWTTREYDLFELGEMYQLEN